MIFITVSLFCVLFGELVFTFPQTPEAYAQQQQQQQQQQPQQQHSGGDVTPIPIISQTEVVGPDGSFNYSYETGNGIHIQEGGYIKKVEGISSRSGQLNEAGDDEGDGSIQVLTGSFSYTAPDGQVISLRYIADENGFQPEGDHLPTPPAIPQDILRSLDHQQQQQSQQQGIQTDQQHQQTQLHQLIQTQPHEQSTGNTYETQTQPV